MHRQAAISTAMRLSDPRSAAGQILELPSLINGVACMGSGSRGVIGVEGIVVTATRRACSRGGCAGLVGRKCFSHISRHQRSILS